MSEHADEIWTIEPRAAGTVARAAEVWRYRHMLLFFGRRAFQRLYRGTILGPAWLVLRPVLPLIFRVFLFGGLLGVGDSVNHVPYFVFVATGMGAWEFFAACVMWGTRSLQMNGGFLSRLYVPRIIVPVATMAPAAVFFAINVIVIIGVLIYYRMTENVWYVDTTWILASAFSLLMIFLMALSIALWTSVLAVEARDVRFVITYILEFWVYLTPVMYPLSRVPADLAWTISYNPMSVFIAGFRGGILGGEGPTPMEWLSAITVAALMLAAGLWFFHRAEARAVDNL